MKLIWSTGDWSSKKYIVREESNKYDKGNDYNNLCVVGLELKIFSVNSRNKMIEWRKGGREELKEGGKENEIEIKKEREKGKERAYIV